MRGVAAQNNLNVRFDQLAGILSLTTREQFQIRVTKECNVPYNLNMRYALVPSHEESSSQSIVCIFEMDAILPATLLGDLRVFYEVASDEPDMVRILAVGRKRGDKFYIAGKEVAL